MLSVGSAFASARGPTIIAANVQTRTGEHTAVVYNLQHGLLYKVGLPARGHDIAFSPVSGSLVAFARRPGNFAVAFDVQNERPPQAFKTPPGRHFYGHGAFSPDGNLLFSTANEFLNATGVIGVWSVGANFKRIGEFRSFGIGHMTSIFCRAGGP